MIRFKTLEKIKQKPIFSNISPVININDDLLEEEDEF